MKTFQDILQTAAELKADMPGQLSFKKVFRVDLLDVSKAETNDLFETRVELTNMMEKRLDSLKDRDLDDEEQAAFDFAQRQLDVINAMITYRKKTDGKGASVPQPVSGEKGLSYRALYGEPEGSSPFKRLGGFLSAVIDRKHDPRLDEYRSMGEASGSAGGYAVPTQLLRTLIDGVIEKSIVLPRCTTIPMDSLSAQIPIFDNSDHSSTLFGGMSVQWLGESDTATPVDGRLRLVSLTAKRCCIYNNVSVQLLSDAPGFEQRLIEALTETIAFNWDVEFLTGSGVGRPQGVINSPGAVTVNRATGGTVTYGDIISMFSRLSPASHDKAIWLANYEVLPTLLSMTDAASHYVWLSQLQGGAQNVPTQLLGKMILFSEKLPAKGSKGDIILADLSQYLVGLRRNILVDSSDAPRWYEFERSLRIETRLDGQLMQAEPVTPKNGTAKLSPVVVLDTP